MGCGSRRAWIALVGGLIAACGGSGGSEDAGPPVAPPPVNAAPQPVIASPAAGAPSVAPRLSTIRYMLTASTARGWLP